MLDFIIEIDTYIFLLLNDFHCAFLDYFMMTFTGKWIWIPMYLMILYVLFNRFGWKKATCYIIGIALTILIADQLCGHLIRPIVERLRPANFANPISNSVHIVDGYRGGPYGFPSCHAANSFALASFTSLLFESRRFTIFIFLWAFINSYTRLYIGVHYPGDLIIGAIIGVLIGYALFYMSKMVAQKVAIYRYKSDPNRFYGQFSLGKFSIVYHNSNAIILSGCVIIFVILIYSLIALI